jgi:hypothetical protein
MSDLRFRSFRMKIYARLCPASLGPKERDEFFRLLDELDEDGMEKYFQRMPLEGRLGEVLALLKQARALGDRLGVLDRTVPSLPHVEIAECYDRLRTLGDQIGNLEAEGVLK